MGTEARDFSRLTPRHGCKCMPDAAVSVEDCLLAVSAVVGGASIRSASRMNKAIVFFLNESGMVDDLIENGLIIKDQFVPVLPLSSPSKKVVLSNVPPFFSNDKLEQLLQRYGKIVSPIKMIPLGCKNPEIKHVMSFRRQVFMILNSQSDPLDLSVKLSIDAKDYTIFISSESMRCFVCGDYGHVRQTCPNRDRPAGPEAAPAVDAGSSEGARRAAADVASAAVELQPQPPGVISAPVDLPEVRPVLVTSNDGPMEPDEEAAGPSHLPVVPQADTGPGQVHSQAVSETDSLSQLDKSADDSFIQSQDDLSSQEPVLDLKVQAEDSENEYYEDIDVPENDAMDSEPTSGGKTRLYSVQEINNFLDITKGVRKPKIETYFPDLKLFLLSCTLAMRKATFDELDKPKRYRLKKLLSNVRSILSVHGKK